MKRLCPICEVPFSGAIAVWKVMGDEVPWCDDCAKNANHPAARTSRDLAEWAAKRARQAKRRKS